MDIRQIYETPVTDRDLGRTVTFLSVSATTLLGQERVEPSTLVSNLELDVLQQFQSPFLLPYAFIALLETESAQAASDYFSKLLNTPPNDALAEVEPERRQNLLEFSRYLTLARVVPFEASPVDVVSIMQAASSPLAVGAALGFAAVPAGPLLFLAVPAGIILVYIAEGVGAALLDRIRKRWGARRRIAARANETDIQV